MTATVETRYPSAARALRATVEGAKRRRLLVAIAAYQDEGHQPSVTELADRAKLTGWRQVDILLRALEAEGLLEVDWSPPRRQGRRRNVYRLCV
jgi:DNA-binding PadR family transcriptional regulator